MPDCAAAPRKTRYAVFLRGVNVGGVTLKMADVATAMRDAGFTDVTTILATGNVVLTAAGDATAVRAAAEAALRHEFGYEAWVLVYAIATVQAIVENYPGKRRYKQSTTTRNLRTPGKVLRG